MNTSASLTFTAVALAAVATTLSAQGQPPAGTKAAPTQNPAAIVEGLKAQLRNLVSAEEAFYGKNSMYTNSLKQLGYRATDGANITVFRADQRGWSGRAVHPDLTGMSCVIWVGPSGEAAKPKTDAAQISGKEGEPVCDPM